MTGEIDAATRRLIRKPRCGVGDSDRSRSFLSDNLHYERGIGGADQYYHRQRSKRYVLQGPKWDKTDLTWR